MYDEALPKKLRDKILRDLKGKPAKAVKHEAGPDHDQADHGNWATGGGVLAKNAERFRAAGGSIDKPVKATDDPEKDYGLQWQTLSDKAIASADALEKAEDADRNHWDTSKYDVDSPQYQKEAKQLEEAYNEANRLALGNKLTADAILSTPFNEVIVARDSKGQIVGALAYMPPEEDQLTVQLLGSTHEVPGTGTALMREAMSIALEKGIPFQVLEPVADARPWYESLGLGPLQMSEATTYHEPKPLYRVNPDALKEILGSSVKSLKHEAGPDHDQADHGSWATGGARLNKYDGKFKAAGGTTESKTIATPKDSRSERAKVERLKQKAIDAWADAKDGSDEANELRAVIEGYRMMDLAYQPQSEYSSNSAVITAKDSAGKIVGALSYYAPEGGPQLTVQFLGTSHEVPGTGTALMREAMQLALDENKTFAVLDPSEKARPWYESLGLGPVVTRHDSLGGERELYTADPDKLKEILGSTAKS